MNESPLILLDVDGVLNAFPPRGDLGPEWIRTRWRSFRLTLNRQHGPKLLALAEDTGAELVWATTWEHDANREIAPLIGLPTLPVIEVDRERQDLGWDIPGVHRKTPYVADYVGDRPFVWFDDDTAMGDWRYLTERCGERFHLVHVDDWYGITDEDIWSAAEWLAGLAGGSQ